MKWNRNMEKRKPIMAVSVGALALLAGGAVLSDGQRAQARDANTATVNIENFIGRIEIETRPGPLRYTLAEGKGKGAALTPSARLDGASLTIAGDARLNRLSCRTRMGQMSVRASGDWVPSRDLPVLKVEAPVGAHLILKGGTVFGEVGNLGRSDIRIDGCGDLRLGDLGGGTQLILSGSGDGFAGKIDGPARIMLTGSGDLRIGDIAGPAEVGLMGSGDLVIGAVAGPLMLGLSGSGDVEITSVQDALDVRSSGSGDVKIHGGRVETAKISVSGSADAYFGGVAGTAHLTSSGSGDIAVRTVTGQVAKSRNGSGDIRVGQ
jgi:hypothetical protein